MNLEYNSSRGRLIIPEYGRNIQKLIDHAVNLPDREERNKIALAIVNVMGQLNPHLRDITDFKHKLWDHLFIISDFKLDVDSPYEKPTALTYKVKPRQVPYHSRDIRYRYYGHIVETMITEITKMEENAEREQQVINLCNFMKMLYITWNKDFVNDETIFEHLRILSHGKLKVKEDTRLNQTIEIPAKQQLTSKKGSSKQRKVRMPNTGNGKMYRK